MTQTTETRYVIEREGDYAHRNFENVLDFEEWTGTIEDAEFFWYEGDAMGEIKDRGKLTDRVRKVTVTTTYVIEGE